MLSQRTFTTTSHKDDDNSSLYDISQTDADAASQMGFGFNGQNRDSNASNTQAPVNLDGKSKSQRADKQRLSLGSASKTPTTSRENKNTIQDFYSSRQQPNQLEAWLAKKRNCDNGWINTQPSKSSVGGIPETASSNIFPINEEDDLANLSDAQFDRSTPEVTVEDTPDTPTQPQTSNSPKPGNPLVASGCSEQMFNKLIQPEQPTMDLAISRADFNAAHLMMSMESRIDIREHLERVLHQNEELRDQLDQAHQSIKQQKTMLDQLLDQSKVIEECEVNADQLNQKLEEQAQLIAQFNFDDSTDGISVDMDSKKWESEKEKLVGEKNLLEIQVAELKTQLAKAQQAQLTQVMSTDFDDLQVQRALMPLLESLVDPSDQIIVQDKQGRTFKIAFCEYQSEETE